MKIALESVDLAAGNRRRSACHDPLTLFPTTHIARIDHVKKGTTPPSMIKSHSTASSTGEKCRHLEDDALILGQMTDLAKTITVPHQVKHMARMIEEQLSRLSLSLSLAQQLDESIKETLHQVNKHLSDEPTPRRTSPEPNHANETTQEKSNYIQLTINTPYVLTLEGNRDFHRLLLQRENRNHRCSFSHG